MSYQFLPPLSDAEYEALREDIAQNGMRHPILVDEKGKILDGHHRARIASQLGFKPEREVLAGLTEVEKRDVAFKMNAARRHMDRDARRRALHASLKADPQLTDRQHGRRVGVDHKTAAALRAEMAGRGEIPHVSTRTDAVGRQVPASRPSSPSGDGKAAARPVDDSHSDDEAPTDATSVGAGETAVEGPGVSPSADADGEGTTTDPDGADAAGDPTDRPSAGSPVNPLDDPEQVEIDRRERVSARVAAGLVHLHEALDPDPIAWLCEWMPDAYKGRGAQLVEDTLTPTGLRTIAKHLDTLADYLDKTEGAL